MDGVGVEESGHDGAPSQCLYNSPDLRKVRDEAIIDAYEAHGEKTKQAFASEYVRDALLEIMMGPGQLYEALRAKGGRMAEPNRKSALG